MARLLLKVIKADKGAINDVFAIATPITGAFIRLGNLMNSEILGKPADISTGDYFIQKVPENLTLKDQTIDLMDTTVNPSKKMGTVEVDNANHQLKFIFNDGIKGKQNIRGDFVAEATETLKKEGKTVTYVLPDGKKQTITYKVNKYQQTDVI